ncbi:C39 family peptidase [Peptoniphilus equinus]|uniref:C39 family peptidase n=1 Tax=Peptoniphilus equinus TaxID=3016343 RepID=A0ABY7QUL8_9FIRM|nr:C39 family peptidase [Peptoniphilus equinus]WBW49588.1 C39 family peptidase [Peptoniphilus equinus]
MIKPGTFKALEAKLNNYAVADLERYMEATYPGAVMTAAKSLDLKDFLQTDFVRSKNNCSLVAMTRLINYHDKEDAHDDDAVYAQIYAIARSYGFSEDYGTMPTKIDNILRDYYGHYRVAVRSQGHYFGNFYNPLKREIDLNRPLIMSIAFGKYRNHTVTVSGYRMYRWRGLTIKVIEIYDGWRRMPAYIDYNAFDHSLLSSGVCSYNTLSFKAE